MNHIYIDTNVIVRFIIKDNKQQNRKTREYIALSQQKKVVLTILTEIILEVEYVLRKTYKIPREDITKSLESVVEMSYFHVMDRDILKQALVIYKSRTVDLIDIILFLKAKKAGADVLSFDKDFGKLKKYIRLSSK
ncbi:hypothetical protein A3B56_02005 [Candidatus Roizmanbacteria bacterium RIFCSPLOWO2_01_FULL_45_11]|uniref:PIN domain-containing protein n=1 Tax=Candidatus Roizmanbacteria bacterium RIFCSPLOWO2_01_FULL_45_11 TaxID=1802070 RepID=A0A1F7JJ04_9BACT|nr:MAG: hypothetical protein A3B56_02005 [Candidatus Roizmanbacteria bacterium RIFCSPLOWO2_01_FULL_45_11]